MRELLKDQMHVPGMGHVYGHDCDGNEHLVIYMSD